MLFSHERTRFRAGSKHFQKVEIQSFHLIPINLCTERGSMKSKFLALSSWTMREIKVQSTNTYALEPPVISEKSDSNKLA